MWREAYSNKEATLGAFNSLIRQYLWVEQVPNIVCYRFWRKSGVIGFCKEIFVLNTKSHPQPLRTAAKYILVVVDVPNGHITGYAGDKISSGLRNFIALLSRCNKLSIFLANMISCRLAFCRCMTWSLLVYLLKSVQCKKPALPYHNIISKTRGFFPYE